MKTVRPAVLGLWLLAAACGALAPAQESSMPTRDINAVLRAHDKGLLAIPGVVGVYVGSMDGGKTPCLTIMVRERTPQVEREIPDSLEGYPVCVEETGVIRPLRNGKPDSP